MMQLAAINVRILISMSENSSSTTKRSSDIQTCTVSWDLRCKSLFIRSAMLPQGQDHIPKDRDAGRRMLWLFNPPSHNNLCGSHPHVGNASI